MEITLNIDVNDNKDIEESIVELIKNELKTIDSKTIGVSIKKEINRKLEQIVECIFEDSDNLYEDLNETISEYAIEIVKKKLGV